MVIQVMGHKPKGCSLFDKAFKRNLLSEFGKIIGFENRF